MNDFSISPDSAGLNQTTLNALPGKFDHSFMNIMS